MPVLLMAVEMRENNPDSFASRTSASREYLPVAYNSNSLATVSFQNLQERKGLLAKGYFG